MSIITITSDWNTQDYYTASLKGSILSKWPEAIIIDISNQVPPFNLSLAAFQLRYSYRHFPSGSVHIIAVNSETADNRPYVAVKANGHFFIGNDNGIFGLLLDNEPEEIVALKTADAGTFPELRVFAEAACLLSKSGKLDELGPKYSELFRQIPMLPAIEESVINGSVVYIDSYKNAITNITLELSQRIGKGRPFEIFVQSNHYRIKRINSRYSESSLGEIVAIFNSVDLLEIAINRGNAADLLNLALNSPIRIKFK